MGSQLLPFTPLQANELNAKADTYYNKTYNDNTLFEIIRTYLNIINLSNYDTMVAAITSTFPSFKVETSTPTLRFVVIESDGTVAYDSKSSAVNTFPNRNVPTSDFLSTGNYKIATPHGGRSYYQIAMNRIPQVNNLTKYSSSTDKYTLYSAMRVSPLLKNPMGVLVMSQDI